MALAGVCWATVAFVPCEAADGAWGGSLVATTDYVFRGLSQTQGGPALQGDLHYSSATGWFAGAWASNIDPGSDYIGGIEVDLYAGWTWAPTQDWSAQLSYLRYLYPDASPGWNYDYGELAAGVSYKDRVFATIAWSPDMDRADYNDAEVRGSAMSYELSLRQPLWLGLSIAGGVGYYDLHNLFGAGYWAWNGTLVYLFHGFELDFSRFADNDTARRLFGNEAANDRWVLTAAWRF